MLVCEAGALGEELRRAGEDTRTMADKRKRKEQSAEGRRKGRDVQGKA